MKLNFKFVSLVTLSISFLLGSAQARADYQDEYNFSWLDPDKKIYVLQNRKFRKAKRASLSLMGGMGLADTYRSAYQVQPRIGTWFNEDFGIEAFYTHRFNSVNNAFRALDQAVGAGTSPLVREIKSQIGVLLNWAPWYAKINVFNTILYFDWYFSLGAGVMSTEIGPRTKSLATSQWKSESLFAVYAGTGHLFHITQVLDFRLDFLGHFYSAPIYGGLASAPADKSLFSGFSLNAGLGVRL